MGMYHMIKLTKKGAFILGDYPRPKVSGKKDLTIYIMKDFCSGNGLNCSTLMSKPQWISTIIDFCKDFELEKNYKGRKN